MWPFSRRGKCDCDQIIYESVKLYNRLEQEIFNKQAEIEKFRFYIKALEEEYYKRTNQHFLESNDSDRYKEMAARLRYK